MKNLPVIILAGGLATRLRPLSEKIPKALIPIKGEPFILHQLRLLRKNGIKKIILCVGFLGDQIEALLGNGKNFNVEIIYSYDGNQLLGTAGAIHKALKFVDDHFLVMYGDSYLPCNYKSIYLAFLASKKNALMTIFHNNNQWDKSNIEFKNGKIIKYDKMIRTTQMQYIDYGIGVFRKKGFSSLDNNQKDLATIYQLFLEKNELGSFEVKNRFYEIGSFHGIQELEQFFLNKGITNGFCKKIFNRS